MASRRNFLEARRAVVEARGNDLSQVFAENFPVGGAAISILAGPATGVTVSASDSIATRLDEMQFDLGEGPCWSALAHRLPALMHPHDTAGEWPTFREAISSDALTRGVMSLYAFPLAIGSLDIGAVDLYSGTSEPLPPELVSEATDLADVAAWSVLRTLLQDDAQGYDTDSVGYARREVHQATGMIIVQLGVDAEDAELLLRAHAFADGRSVRDVAKDVVARRIDFTGKASD